ncbi:unnamed protein product [Arctia plantaginis]|uniref:CHK kinase-like domain-containing protein n=1 Tax=Arctia plantaginis TaxID=874455 RepID=A0A8S0YQX6_ARCPL|nr:unnamed protein product [Arctia plantaginis]
MGVVTNNEGIKANNYNVHRKAGRSIIDHRPVFSPDGESVAIIVENIVRVYNIQTGDCVRTLETEIAVKELVAVQFPENEDYNLYGCSHTGYVTIWTWDKGAVLREIKLKLPSNAKVLTFDLVDSNECCITYKLPKQKYLVLSTFSVKTGELLYEYKDTKVICFDMLRISLGWCNGDRFAALTNGTKYLFIQNLQQPHLKTQIINHNQYRITSVAAHQKTNAVAITDTLGRTTIIRGNLYDHRQIAREVLHWHFLPPLATCFSLQGNYLYTGGMEKVLVKWTMGNLAYRANEKAFIPRLPGMIRFITTNNNHVAITMTNNSVVIANAQLRVVSTILECGGLSPVARAVGGALVYHQPLEALIIAGRTGHLQLYSTTTDKVLYNLDITETNSLPSERWNLLPLETEVTCAAVSGNGEWLVTSEYRNDGIIYPEEKLKFWQAQYNKATPFHLNTCVNLSHGGCNVVSLALNKKGEFCVSAGADQKFRIWKRENTSQTHRKTVAWACLTACYYSSGVGSSISNNVLNNFKEPSKHKPGKDEDLPYLREINNKNDIIKRLFNIHKEHSLADEMGKVSIGRDDSYSMGGVAISQDGSLIAAWFGSKLTLWDTHLCNLRTTLSHPALRPKGVNVLFGNKDAAHYLICTTENCLAVWSLLSLTVKWLVQITPTCIAAHRFSNKVAVVTTNNDVYVFTPHNSTPILTKKKLVDPSTGVFKQCTFGTCFDDDISLYLMRNDSEIYCIEPEASEEGRLEVISHRKLPTSNFSALLAEQQLSEVQAGGAVDINAVDVSALATSSIAQFSLASPHMVPAISLLCTSFLQRLSGMEQPALTDDTKEEPMEIDADSSDEEDTNNSKLNGSYSPRATELWTPNYEVVKEKKLNRIKTEPFLDLHSTSSMFVESNGIKSEVMLFVKCMPRFDKWKAEYLNEVLFFKKEYIMLTKLFKEFEDPEGVRKWRPKLLFSKENIFVFENVLVQGYKMPDQEETLSFEELKSTIVTLARFHAQSYIYEERKSKELGRAYRIWEQYSDYLQESIKGLDWRDTGRNAAIDFLKEYSKYKFKPNFNKYLEAYMPGLYDRAMELMKPSTEYRNVVVHRDLWTNNIFLKEANADCHAIFVDFQTVIYCSPMLDLSSLIYFNTTRANRLIWTEELIEFYYSILSQELEASGINAKDIFNKSTVKEAYEKSIVFGITQASLVTPVIVMRKDKREEIFGDPKSSRKANVESRSKEFIEMAKEDDKYRIRVTELLDEILERFVFQKDNGLHDAMATLSIKKCFNHNIEYITEEDINLIISRDNSTSNGNISKYYVHTASDKMLGFLSEYLKLKVCLTNQKVLYFFIKAISKTNVAKAEMVKEMKLFEKEMIFYLNVKKILEVPGMEPWSPRLITQLKDAMVFEDLNALNYKLKNKFERFDMTHTFQALRTLARFHASSIIYEVNKSKETGRPYKINDDYKHVLNKGGYHLLSEWYIQCMTGSLEAIKVYSKYNKTEIHSIERYWSDIWSTALDLSEYHPGQTNVICHRDLWNNNIMFHYEDDKELGPDSCLFVDFQAVRYQPPASDVMVLLCCNLEPTCRRENIDTFFNFYYAQLQKILSNYNIEINDIMTKNEFLVSAEEQTKWGLIVCACLIPQFWLDDDLTTNIFSDNVQFDEILTKNKGLFIKKMMAHNDYDYRKNVMDIFEEIAERYCFG